MWVHLVMTGLALALELFDFLSGDCKALFVTVWPCIWGPGIWICLPRHKMKDHLKMQACREKMQDARCKIARCKIKMQEDVECCNFYLSQILYIIRHVWSNLNSSPSLRSFLFHDSSKTGCLRNILHISGRLCFPHSLCPYTGGSGDNFANWSC